VTKEDAIAQATFIAELFGIAALTPKSIEQPPMAVGARSTEFRNETEVSKSA
jgi:hypothetical protein